MYDNCGHDHCNRLLSEISVGATDDSNSARMELALWLWEVHNSVNARLMKEAAQRQNREVSYQETLASRFPTTKMCPDCWLDVNMTKWDNAKVYHFLDEWYWPSSEPSNEQFKSVIAGNAEEEEELSFKEPDHMKLSSKLPSWGAGVASLLCLITFSLLAVAAAQKKRREKRKKFIDSRFERKKQQQGFNCC